MQAVEEMGVSHGGGNSLQPSLSDSEGSSEDDETEGGPTSQDNAAVLETGMESRRTLCSTQSRTTSDKLSELQPSCSSSITGVLSQDEGRRVPSETSSSLLLTVEPPDQDAGQNNEGSYQDGGLSVQELQKGDGEVGGSGGGEEDSGTDEDGDSEGSSTFPSPSVGLQTLSLQTQAHQPSRDKRRTDSKSSSPTATSYMQGDQTRIRQLVKRTVAKKRKQQKQRQQSKPKKDTASAAARRSKKSSRRAVRQDDFW